MQLALTDWLKGNRSVKNEKLALRVHFNRRPGWINRRCDG